MTATLVLTNGQIDTQDPVHPFASAVAIRGDRILAVGKDEEMKALLGPGGEWLDLSGRSVTPGLVDAHVHFHWFSLNLSQIDLFEVPSLAEALGRIGAFAGRMPPDKWLEGRGWTQELWSGRSFPTAADLDQVVTNRPIYLRHKSGHAAWVNSLALRLAGITANTPDPAGGQIQRDSHGQPTGILFESAMELVSQHIAPAGHHELVAAMSQAQQVCWQAGLTGIHDFDGPESFRALQSLHLNGQLGLRFVKNIPVYRLEQAIGLGLQSGFGDDWLRIGGVKIFADGALGPRTALMIAPYQGEPHNRGIAVTDKEEMLAQASAASAAGLSVTVHAIGDLANHNILDVYEVVRREEQQRGVPAGALRHRIEHVQILHPADQPRLAQLGIIASMQPTHATSDMLMADRYWGERASHSYAWRTVLNSGATLVFGSDCPIEPIQPLLGIAAAVTRTRPDGTPGPEGWYPEQRLSLAETIRAFTWAAAYTAGRETQLGSITPGKLADLTIFDRDIYRTRPESLYQTQIAATIIGGQFKYRTL